MQTVQAPVTHSTCRTLRTAGFLQRLSPAVLADLTSIGTLKHYEAGEMLLSEKQEATGVYLIREGMVRLSMNSSDGKRLSLRVARA